ncbi:MAG: ATP-binding protein [Candidatus Krumholzibacteriia bacterium]
MLQLAASPRPLFAALGLLFFYLSCLVTPATARRLELDPARAPYEFRVFHHAPVAEGSGRNLADLMADIDGDGIDELVTCDTDHILGFELEDGYLKPVWQVNFEPGWVLRDSSSLLGVARDIDGDGVEEIFLTICTPGGIDWRFLVIDGLEGKIVSGGDLPKGPDRRQDGVWDGRYLAMGVLGEDEGLGREALILARMVGYDAYPRGLLAVDPRTGESIWEFLCGPNVNPESYHQADLDGDGQQEIIFYGHPPDNLGGERINGTSDDHAYLFVLNTGGQLLWRKEIGPAFYSGDVDLGDVDGDGTLEILTSNLSGAPGAGDKLTIWDWPSREVLAQRRGHSWYFGVEVVPGPRPGTSWLFVGSNNGTIDRLLYEDGTLVRDAEALSDEPRCEVLGLMDLLPEPGPELIVDHDTGSNLLVLDTDLNTLAVYPDPSRMPREFVFLWDSGTGEKVLVGNQTRSQWMFKLTKRPMAWGRILLRAGMGLGLAAALMGVFFWGRRLGRAAAARDAEVRTPQTTVDREVLFRVWQELDDVKHERLMEASKGLRRLVWLMEAYATELGEGSDLRTRIHALMREFHEADLPRLQNILRRAEGETFAPDLVFTARRSLASLVGKLNDLDGSDLTVARIAAYQPDLARDVEQIEEGFLGLWTALRDYFACDPVRMLQGMLVVGEVELKRAGIRVEVQPPEPGVDLRCLIDTAELRHILVNLLDNAIRALRDGKRRVIAVVFRRSGQEISLEFSDTGAGIDPAQHERVFSGRFSSRPGGGQGLFRSREILHRWRGEIELTRSAPGQGTTFTVKLRAAYKAGKSAALEAEA